MDSKRKDDMEIEDLLRSSADQEAPPWLKQKIMNRIYHRKPRLHRRLAEWFLAPLTLRFSPAAALLVVVFAATAFLGGVLVERRVSDTGVSEGKNILRYADDAQTNYQIGRNLLAENKQEEALHFFRRAAELEPQNPEYGHWQGVAYWALDDPERERQSYFETVRNHPDYLPSVLNLGHSYLEGGNFRAALQQYRKVLRNDPDVPEALYNSALAHGRLDNTAMQIRYFKRYLSTYRTGMWAHRAMRHLHHLQDYTYRSYRIGVHRIIVNMSALVHPDSELGNREAEYLADIMRGIAGQELHIVAYNEDDRTAAKETALNLRRVLVERIGEEGFPLKLSWFKAAETVAFDGENLQLSPSVLIFSTPISIENRRTST